MSDPEYVVERSIEDVEFSEQFVEEIRERIRHELVDEGVTNLTDPKVERRVKEKLEEIARDRTLNEQGDNRLHNDIDHELQDEPGTHD